MKAFIKSLSLLALLALFFAPGLVRAQDAPPPPPGQGDQDDQGVSFQTFYDQLGDQGTWVQTDDYGYVFQPNVSDPDWAPYTDGHWVDTDEGWTWVSDEPWGWATYHYGRWANIDDVGWVWVPGYQWAPAWVSWRYGGGYAGWAPLPPDTFYGAEYGDPGAQVGIGFHFGGDVDVAFHIGPGCYNFVRVEDIGERSYRGRFVNRNNNFAVINNTTNITNINVRGSGNNANINGGRNRFAGVAAGGPPINEVNARARTHVQRVQLAAASQPGQATVQGNSLAVFAPRVNPGTAHQGRPASVAQTVAHPTFNRGDNVTKPLAVTATVRPAAPTAEVIQAAQHAQATAPAHAKIATEKTPIKTTFTKPLTALEPVAQTPRTHQAGAATVNPAVAQPNGVKPATASGIHPNANVANPNGEVKHHAANAPFTGESATPSVTQPNGVKPATAGGVNPNANVANPNGEVKHHAANAPLTGESVTPSATQSNEAQAQAQAKARQEQVQAQVQAQVRQDQAAAQAKEQAQAQAKFQQQSQVHQQQPAQTYHPSAAQPAQTYHPSAAQPAQTYHPSAAQPAQTYHPSAAPAPAAKPAAAQPAAAPQGGGQAAGGNGNKKNPNDPNNPQGH